MVRNAERALFSGTCVAARVLESERQNGSFFTSVEKAQEEREGSRPKPREALLRTPFRRHPTACLWNQELICPPPQPAPPSLKALPLRKTTQAATLRASAARDAPGRQGAGHWRAPSTKPRQWPLPPDRLLSDLRMGDATLFQSSQIADCSPQPTSLFTLAARKIKPSFPPTSGRACSI